MTQLEFVKFLLENTKNNKLTWTIDNSEYKFIKTSFDEYCGYDYEASYDIIVRPEDNNDTLIIIANESGSKFIDSSKVIKLDNNNKELTDLVNELINYAVVSSTSKENLEIEKESDFDFLDSIVKVINKE